MTLPPRANLDWLRRAARELLNGLKRGEPAATARLASLPPALRSRAPTLTLAQTVIARERGFASWPKLKAAIEARAARRDAKPPSPTRALAQRLAAVMVADAESGDPARLALRPGVGRGVSLLIRETLEAEPEVLRRVQDVYLQGLSHPSPKVRFECAHAIDFYGDATCRGPLVVLLDDPVPRVRRMAVHALGCDACKADLFGDDEDLRRRLAAMALGDPSVQVRRHAVWAVGAAGGAEAAATLRRVLANEGDTAALRNARLGLRRLGEAA